MCPHFKCFEQPLELTNGREVNNRETERGGGNNEERWWWGRRGTGFLHKLYVLVSVCSCLYLGHSRIKICVFTFVGLCMWHAGVKCVWETVALSKCLSLMGMTLPSAVQPSCVGKLANLCVATMTILPVISFLFPLLFLLFSNSLSFLFPLSLHQRAFFVSSVA